MFYVPVENEAQKTDLQQSDLPSGGTTQTGIVSPSIEDKTDEPLPIIEGIKAPAVDNNISSEQHDINKDNLENEYEHLDPIYEELQEVSNSAKRKYFFNKYSYVLSFF